MSYLLPRFTPFAPGQKVQILSKDGVPVENSDPNNLWTIGKDGDTWSFVDASDSGRFFEDKQAWNIRWSGDPDTVFLYVVEQENDPNEPDPEVEPPDYFWEEDRRKYLYRQGDGTLGFEDRTQIVEEPDVDAFGWKFRNEILQTESKVTSRFGSTDRRAVWTVDNELHARVANLPELHNPSWNSQSELQLTTVRAQNVTVDSLDVHAMGNIRFPPSFRSRARLSIRNPNPPFDSFGVSESNIELQSEEHVWVLSNERDSNTWTITSETEHVSFPAVRFRRLNHFSGYFVVDVSDATTRLYLNHALNWVDFTQNESLPTFEEDHPELRWDVASATRDASFDRYATGIVGEDGMLHSEKSGQTITLRHATLNDRGEQVPTPSNLLSSIVTDEFGHVTDLIPFDSDGSNLLRRESVLQYEQKGWDAVGEPNDLETLQDWIGVVEDQYARSWWTTPNLKNIDPTIRIRGGIGVNLSETFGTAFGDNGWFGGGGAGGSSNTGSFLHLGGRGGGGSTDGGDGKPYTGGGGGGGNAIDGTGGKGGSGMVILQAPVVGSNTPTRTFAFHHGAFDETAYGDGDVTEAAARGRYFTDMPPNGGLKITVDENASTSNQTAYTLTPPAWATQADVLVVAGGGGGGSNHWRSNRNDRGGGGGGAGGGVYKTNIDISSSQSISIEVGGGGAGHPGGTQFAGSNGYDSNAFGLRARGGGGGGTSDAGDSVGRSWGRNGGSGGGDSHRQGGGGGNATQPGTNSSADQDMGHGGGRGRDTGSRFSGGGGGGMSTPGANGEPNQAGSGGDGADFSSQFGVEYGDQGVFGGGGGGAERNGGSIGIGGVGGGGNGSLSSRVHGQAHTGGGGGAGRFGGNGGSGIVLVKLKSADGSLTQTLAFHHGVYDGTYDDTFTNAIEAAQNGRIFADTGDLVMVSVDLEASDNSKTVYKFTPAMGVTSTDVLLVGGGGGGGDAGGGGGGAGGVVFRLQESIDLSSLIVTVGNGGDAAQSGQITRVQLEDGTVLFEALGGGSGGTQDGGDGGSGGGAGRIGGSGGTATQPTNLGNAGGSNGGSEAEGAGGGGAGDSGDPILGGSFGGSANYGNAVTNSDGLVILTPHMSPRAFVFEPPRYTLQSFDFGAEPGDFAGGVLTENGEIALVPYDELRIAFVRHPTWNPRYGEDLPDVGAPEHRFFGGARTTNNQIVCAPFDADRVAVYDERLPDGQRWFTSTPLENIGANAERYRGAVFCPDGQVVCIPHAANTFLHVLENGTLFERLDSSLEDGLYVPDESNLIETIDPGAFGKVTEESNRQSDVTIVIDARFPTIQEVQDEGDMCLFNAGQEVRAVWIGVRRIGGLVEFYARAGDSRPPPNNGATILRFPNATFLDGRVHRLVVDIQPGEENGDSKKGGQMRVFVDDLLRGQRNIENILAFAAGNPPQWAGPGPRNMYGGLIGDQLDPIMPFDETGEPMSANEWFGFPRTLLSPARLYSGLRNTQDSPVSIPRTALLNWDRAWIHQIDTPKLTGYDTMEVPENPSEEFGELQREWRDPSPSSDEPHYPISIETSVFPKNPRALNNEQADKSDVYWRNWSMIGGDDDWKYSASSVLNPTFPASSAFQDNASTWQSARGEITPSNSQSLFLEAPQPLHPRGYTIRSWFNSESATERYRPSDWNLYGIDGNGARVELDTKEGISFSESANRSERTQTFSINTTKSFSKYELEITRTSDDAQGVAIELWDMTFSPYDGTLGRPIWKLMNKNTNLNAASGWRIAAENLASNADAIVTYHEPRRLHAVEITAGPRFSAIDPLGIKSVQVQGRNDIGDVWEQILTMDGWVNPGDIVEETLDEPSKPFQMFRLLVTELPEGADYVSVQEWNLKTSAPLPVEDMFDNEDPFVVELGGKREEDPENPIRAYWGGAFTSRGIVCAPYDADEIGIYDLATRQFFPSENGKTGPNKYAGARTLSNGLVALFPHSSNAKLLIYDPTNDAIVSEIDVGADGNAYAGGALTFDGQMLLAPYDSQNVRILDTGIIPHPALVTHPSVN